MILEGGGESRGFLKRRKTLLYCCTFISESTSHVTKKKKSPENNCFKIQKAHWIHKIKLKYLFILGLYSEEGLRCHNRDRDQGRIFRVLTKAKIGIEKSNHPLQICYIFLEHWSEQTREYWHQWYRAAELQFHLYDNNNKLELTYQLHSLK